MENKDMDTSVVPQDAIDGFEAVRQSGLINMFDATGVVKIMLEMGYHDGANWLIDFDRGRADIKKYTLLLEKIQEPYRIAQKLMRK